MPQNVISKSIYVEMLCLRAQVCSSVQYILIFTFASVCLNFDEPLQCYANIEEIVEDIMTI